MTDINNYDDFNFDDSSDDLLYEIGLTMDNSNQVIAEEKCLSQKLSQLSTSEDDRKQINESKRSPPSPSTSTIVSTVSKKIKVDHDYQQENNSDDDIVEEIIPNYLLINNSHFQQLFHALTSTTATSLTIEGIQEIALLLRQITILNLQRSLWNIYLQSGIGKLETDFHQSIIPNESVFLWPSEVKSTLSMKNKKQQQQQQNELTTINHNTCLKYVNKMLDQYMNHLIDYEKKLKNKNFRPNNLFTLQIKDDLMQYIEQQEIRMIRIEIESKIAIVKYDYQDHLIEWEYNQLIPNSYQLQLWKNIIQLKQEKEKSKYEVTLLKQRRLHHHLPAPLKSLQLPLLSTLSIDTIHDLKIREHLMNRYRKINEETKSEMMTLYIHIAEAKMNENLIKFNENIAQIRSNQQLTQSMMNIIERRFKNIDERFEYLYQLKVRALERQNKTLSNRKI
ncbi:unnamed protein product [Adineta steineri]|uniref:Uncharacterized protein n=1 Tax=Adineta steineri TaxID=433720 RepID=A0A815GFZ8_9BILA|nr:unnamed protein product [Adineta steineri]CAF1592243.1 unnamed protein product [Adineta steineri]